MGEPEMEIRETQCLHVGNYVQRAKKAMQQTELRQAHATKLLLSAHGEANSEIQNGKASVDFLGLPEACWV